MSNSTKADFTTASNNPIFVDSERLSHYQNLIDNIPDEPEQPNKDEDSALDGGEDEVQENDGGFNDGDSQTSSVGITTTDLRPNRNNNECKFYCFWKERILSSLFSNSNCPRFQTNTTAILQT